MNSLHSCQSAFCEAIFSGSDAALGGMLVEPDEVARRRLSAYRRSIVGTLSAAVLSAYPVVARIVGTPFFMEAARQFIHAVPSASGDLNEFGESFGDFLAGYPHAAHLGYLPDVARMEWLVQQVFYAPETPPADLTILARIPDDRYGELCFSIAPGYARINSRWPLADIWRINQAGFSGDMAVDFSAGSQVLISRRNGLVYVEPLSAGEAVFLDALTSRRTLGAATAEAADADPGFDLAATLHSFVSQGLLWSAELGGRAEA
jgi:hypothetical protein